jgi:hypothetical protein
VTAGSGRRCWPVSAGSVPGVIAWFSAGLALALCAACVVLTYLTKDLPATFSGILPVLALVSAGLGMVIVRRQPRNPIGWLLVASGVLAVLFGAAGLYAVLDYRIHHGTLPAGRAAVFAEGGSFLIAVLYGLAILLFPDGTLPSRRWRWVIWVYLTASVMFTANKFIAQSTVLTVPYLRVDATGSPVNNPDPVGTLARAVTITGYALPVIAALWVCFVGLQLVRYLRAAGERRQQLKWLVSGSASCVAGIVVTIDAGNYSGPVAQAVLAAGVLGVAALPASLGMAVLKYRLYDIDRIISRTLAYAIVTGLLIGVYAGLVLLATQVLRFHSAVAVAVSTLVAAALFNPLRRRVQRAVDRRFNRARYDADRIVATFAAGLKEAVDLDSVREDLAAVVQKALEPARVSVWIGTDQRH